MIDLIFGLAFVYVTGWLWLYGMLWIADTLTKNGIRWPVMPENHW